MVDSPNQRLVSYTVCVDRFLDTLINSGQCLLIYVYNRIQGGIRRGGPTPALAPRMPAITEDVGQSRP